jgi:hypothetical protein
MLHNFLFKASFHSLLNAIDQDLVEKTKEKGCVYCGSELHQAKYPRSPLGLPSQFRETYRERRSFCCRQCRKRVTPESVKFFGRRRYPAALHILISLLKVGVSERRLIQIKKHFGIVVSESTWKRWRRWFREKFLSTAFWQQSKGFISIHIEENKAFPRALLKLFKGALGKRMQLLLQFLSPLTGGIFRAI